MSERENCFLCAFLGSSSSRTTAQIPNEEKEQEIFFFIFGMKKRFILQHFYKQKNYSYSNNNENAF